MAAETYTLYIPPPPPPPKPTTALEDTIKGWVYPFSHSPRPAWTLASLFACTAVLPPGRFPRMPNVLWRLGFTWIFAGSGYILSTGDIRNGSGTTTGCALIYLFYHMRSSLRAPRSGPYLLLTAATSTIAGIYGSEYFRFRRFDDDESYKVKF